MAEERKIYGCATCGNRVKVYGGDCDLLCCDKPMEELGKKSPPAVRIIEYAQKTLEPTDYIEAESLF